MILIYSPRIKKYSSVRIEIYLFNKGKISLKKKGKMNTSYNKEGKIFWPAWQDRILNQPWRTGDLSILGLGIIALLCIRFILIILIYSCR